KHRLHGRRPRVMSRSTTTRFPGGIRGRYALGLAAVTVLAALIVPLQAASAGRAAPPPAIQLLRMGEIFSTGSVGEDKASGHDVYLWLETLLKLGPSGQVQPDLAQSFSQPGPAVYVFHLRHGVKFWDGNELTAADVANALNFYRYPALTTSVNY